jgi:uncharacterized membrane protein
MKAVPLMELPSSIEYVLYVRLPAAEQFAAGVLGCRIAAIQLHVLDKTVGIDATVHASRNFIISEDNTAVVMYGHTAY